MRNSILLYVILIVCILAAGCTSKEMAPEPMKMSTAPRCLAPAYTCRNAHIG